MSYRRSDHAFKSDPTRPGFEKCARPGCPWWAVDLPLPRGEGFTTTPDDWNATLASEVPECGPVRETKREAA